MITKRAQAQFSTLINAVQNQALYVVECYDIKMGKPEYVVCAHHSEGGVEEYQPLAKLFRRNPTTKSHRPGLQSTN